MDAENRKIPIGSRLAERIKRVQSSVIATGHYCAMLILNMNNIRYLVGFTGSDGALLISRRDVFLLVDGRYTTQARSETDVNVIEYRDKIEGIANTIVQEKFTIVGFESSAISYDLFFALQSRLERIQFKPLKQELEPIRCIKDDGEIESIIKAAEIAATAYCSILESIKPGMEERALALELDYRMRSEGAESSAFDIILASGPNSALPHAKPGRRKISEGDFITIDFGATYKGYHSDETCTVALGKIGEDQAAVYSIVKEAHDRGLARIKAGIPCKEIDQAVRSYIEEKGFGSYFGHGTGHGVGLDIHEFPRLAPATEAVLEAGMVITVEPGIYIPGKWGVRIEDLILVKENGCEVLSKINKNLNIISPN